MRKEHRDIVNDVESIKRSTESCELPLFISSQAQCFEFVLINFWSDLYHCKQNQNQSANLGFQVFSRPLLSLTINKYKNHRGKK